jgi:hypothetical protein
MFTYSYVEINLYALSRTTNDLLIIFESKKKKERREKVKYNMVRGLLFPQI